MRPRHRAAAGPAATRVASRHRTRPPPLGCRRDRPRRPSGGLRGRARGGRPAHPAHRRICAHRKLGHRLQRPVRGAQQRRGRSARLDAAHRLPAGSEVATLWNGRLARGGGKYTIRDEEWNRVLRPGETAVVGFEVRRVDPGEPPTELPLECTINDRPCGRGRRGGRAVRRAVGGTAGEHGVRAGPGRAAGAAGPDDRARNRVGDRHGAAGGAGRVGDARGVRGPWRDRGGGDADQTVRRPLRARLVRPGRDEPADRGSRTGRWRSWSTAATAGRVGRRGPPGRPVSRPARLRTPLAGRRRDHLVRRLGRQRPRRRLPDARSARRRVPAGRRHVPGDPHRPRRRRPVARPPGHRGTPQPGPRTGAPAPRQGRPQSAPDLLAARGTGGTRRGGRRPAARRHHPRSERRHGQPDGDGLRACQRAQPDGPHGPLRHRRRQHGARPTARRVAQPDGCSGLAHDGPDADDRRGRRAGRGVHRGGRPGTRPFRGKPAPRRAVVVVGGPGPRLRLDGRGAGRGRPRLQRYLPGAERVPARLHRHRIRQFGTDRAGGRRRRPGEALAAAGRTGHPRGRGPDTA
ncbi:cellulose binding domain-containing protein [Yinghuangia aomiensis]